MSKIDGLISDLESVLEKLGSVHSRLRELKEDLESVEKARDRLRAAKLKKPGDTH